MKKLLIVMALLIGLAGCATEKQQAEVEMAKVACPPETLAIQWQRVVDEGGKICERCELTQQGVRRAYQTLKASLEPLEIAVTLEERHLASAECAKDSCQSNRIWISGRALERWLGAQVGMSPCGGCGGDEAGGEMACRSLLLAGKRYDAIPADLIVKAGLLAASALYGPELGSPCWSAEASWKGDRGECDPSKCPHGASSEGRKGDHSPSKCEEAGSCKGHKSECDPSKHQGSSGCKRDKAGWDPSMCEGGSAKSGKATCP